MAGPKEPKGPKPEAAPGDEGFLGRWSRRKAEAVAASDPADLAANDSADLVEEETEGTPSSTGESSEREAFDVSTLPDIDSLGPGSDFSMFMQAGVPPALKTKALRKLWRVKPELANLDGLLDYGEDLTGSFKVVDHLKTAYEVGRGFLKDRDRDEQEQEDLKEVDGEDESDQHPTRPVRLKARVGLRPMKKPTNPEQRLATTNQMVVPRMPES